MKNIQQILALNHVMNYYNYQLDPLNLIRQNDLSKKVRWGLDKAFVSICIRINKTALLVNTNLTEH